ncbi:DUF2878 domain-containing protein [Desulfuromonas sp. AOP6]|uniref:DUF2878 domain-containing protein n=1 Tax=Desulfuromonas sp. AOP6 TaxID=1566351 RepID=UPI0012741343|nr:DUF2878 domain-containing protein [Desulfuromonas sp. AOP6]BCA79299.1 membrane protein [Desulfuromonas sp. AOP6]
MTPLASKVLNFFLYQTGWFFCVLGAAWGYPITGALLSLLLIVVHLLLAGNRRNEILLLGSACLLGVTIDSLQQGLGLFTFRSDPGWPLWIPLWVFVIWAQFATLFHYALRWMAGRYVLAALLGGVGGPLAYGAGMRLGAASLGDLPVLTFLSLALVWASVTPALLWLSERFGEATGSYRGMGKRA